jgi:peptide/nickel transport system permease protein
MGTYIARRLLHAAIIMVGLAVCLFFLVHLSPQGPCDAIREAGGQNAEGAFQACVLRYGLDKPLPVQFVAWATNVLHGDFGLTADGQEVGSAILERLPATVLLVGTALLLQLALALPLGILGALQRYTWADQVLTLGAYVFLSTPTFWLGVLAILIFAVDLNWVPPTGIVDITRFPAFGTEAYWLALQQQPLAVLGDLLHHLLLPACVFAVVGIGTESRYMRAGMLDVLHREYIRTARAKGLPRRVVIYKHALRNAVLPVVTNVGLSLPRLVAGSIIIESVFSWPGLGLLFFHALTEQSYATLQALLLLSALAVLLGNLVTDLAYAAIDPRIRYDYTAP